MVGALERTRTAIPPCVACVNLCSLPRGGYRQTERGVRGWRAWARQPRTTFSPLLPILYFLQKYKYGLSSIRF